MRHSAFIQVGWSDTTGPEQNVNGPSKFRTAKVVRDLRVLLRFQEKVRILLIHLFKHLLLKLAHRRKTVCIRFARN